MKTINVHIERLILDGLPLDQRQGGPVGAAVERELSRLLADSGSASLLGPPSASASLQGGSIQVTERTTPGAVGEQIAGAVHAGLGVRP